MLTPIVIMGPTGSGKTEIAAELSKLLNGEIISADSRQVYKYLDIGTNKAGFWDKDLKLRTYKGIAQHLTDIIEPDQEFNAGDFSELANKIILTLTNSHRTPVITGGTGLYIKALVDGLSPMPGQDKAIRERLQNELERFGKEHLYEKLKISDPVSAQNNRHNPQRLIRALEVFEITKVPISELQKVKTPQKNNFIQYALSWDRKELYLNLDKRSQAMLDSGMIEEAKKVLKDFGEDARGLKSIGYDHIVKYLKGEISYGEMALLFKTDMRHYAKRQMTWFRKDPRISWIALDGTSYNPSLIAQRIFKNLPKMI